MLGLSAVQSPSEINACSAIQACNGITQIPTTSTPIANTYAVDLDGVDDYADIPDADALSFGNASVDSAFSISAWVKMDDATRFAIACKKQDIDNREYLFSTLDTDCLLFELYDQSASHRINILSDSPITSSEGGWAHIVGTYDGSGNSSGLKLYLNGSVLTSTTASSGSYTAMHNTGGKLDLGRFAIGNFYANGKMDEITFIPSELSAAQVSAIYNGGVPADLTSYSPVGWWRMGDNDGGTGTTITDQGSGGNDATLTNGATFSTDVPT